MASSKSSTLQPHLQGWPAGKAAAACAVSHPAERWLQGQGLDVGAYLAAFLNACFIQGRLPACVSSALVTPIHKKGAVAGTANYRPIAVGEPLCKLSKLYTIILSARLVAWSEKHGLRSPVQASLRPGLLPVHHLFALWHFIDRAILQRRPLFVTFFGPAVGL